MANSSSFSSGLKQKLTLALARNGWTSEDVDLISSGDKLKHIRDDYVVGVKLYRPRQTHFCVTECDGRSVDRLIEAGKYFFVPPCLIEHIKSDQFKMSEVFQDVIIELLEFTFPLNLREFRDYIHKHGYKPATTEDAIRLGAEYSNDVLKTDNAILFTERPWVDQFGRVNLTALWMTDHCNRTLSCCVYEDTFGPGTVVAVRKRVVERQRS